MLGCGGNCAVGVVERNGGLVGDLGDGKMEGSGVGRVGGGF